MVRGRAADMASRFERGQLETENGHEDATQNGTEISVNGEWGGGVSGEGAG